MKNVLLIEASPRVGWSKKAADRIATQLESKGSEVVRITLRDETIAACGGCSLCLGVGSEKCRFRDDSAHKILTKMLEADGIVIVTPNYSLQVPGILKDMLDRLAFVFHRPSLFGKVFMPVVVQGVYGGGKILKYLNEVMDFWGVRSQPGVVLTGAVYPNSKKDPAAAAKDDVKLIKATDDFLEEIIHGKPKSPSLFRLFIYRMTRSSMKYFKEALPPDREYYEKMGWFTAPYYYPVRLNPFKTAVGALGDSMIRGMAKKETAKKESI